MTTPNGYNNPAYCHQYDPSLYDYQYVPEIDPDSPDLNTEVNRKQSLLIHPNSKTQFSESDDFEGSDESNGSIIIEECNNRRVTMICEKRHETGKNSDDYYEEENEEERATYYQDVSLESENGNENESSLKRELKTEERSLRHQRPLDPPLKDRNGSQDYSSISINSNYVEKKFEYQPCQRYHRYEEIPSDTDIYNHSSDTTSVHRYAEISADENGYPTLKSAIEIQKTQEDYYPCNTSQTSKAITKPRAVSPVSYKTDYPQSFTPTRNRQTNPSYLQYSSNRSILNSPSQTFLSITPNRNNSYEMAELSPPRSMEPPQHLNNQQTFFMNSPKRHPVIGASAVNDAHDPFLLKNKCIIPSHLQKHPSRPKKERSHSAPNSPKKNKDIPNCRPSPNKSQLDKKVMHIFHIKPAKSTPSKSRLISRGRSFNGRENNTARRNISNSFIDLPNEPSTPRKRAIEPLESLSRSPYKPTTAEIVPPKTAIITPIFQRKTYQSRDDEGFSTSPRRNFEKMSQTFQSTGNLFKTTKEQIHSVRTDLFRTPQDKSITVTRIKRNQSVPNFAQTFALENGVIFKKSNEMCIKENSKAYVNLQYSPEKPYVNRSPNEKSRMSLLDQFSSWSNSEIDYYPRCSTCFIIATIIHLITATATCAISFYLLSKVGRRYYLDFGLLAGFINFTLGLLGFRSYCWRWLPNRNYVSGFIALAAFSALTCAGLSYLIIVRPMSGDPMLDILGGAICAVSVLTILLALTGLTMSGCCKTPPPDNRVNHI